MGKVNAARLAGFDIHGSSAIYVQWSRRRPRLKCSATVKPDKGGLSFTRRRAPSYEDTLQIIWRSDPPHLWRDYHVRETVLL